MQRILLLGVAGILLLSGGLGYWLVTRNTHGSGKVPFSGALGTQIGKLIQDTWEAAYYLDGSRAGNIHTEVREVASPQGREFHHHVVMNLLVRRYGAVVPMKMEQSTVESSEGKVLALGMVQHLDQGSQILKGRVEGTEVVVSQGAVEKRLPFPPDVMGPVAQERTILEKSREKGASWKMTSYELSLQAPTHLDARTLGEEETETPRAPTPEKPASVVREKLEKVEISPQPVKIGGQEITLPTLEVWCKEGKAVKSRVDMPGLGPITLVRCGKEEAERPGKPGEIPPDLGARTLVFLDRPISRVHDLREVAYQFQLPGDKDPAKAFTLDARQVASGEKGDGFILTVKGGDSGFSPAPQPGKASLESNFYIDSADPLVTELAAKAIGEEKDPWRKVLRIEALVHQRMNSTSSVGFARASQIARDLRGDCRQHAMLTAAVCRACGVPARTALGLVYIVDEPTGKPALGFHMWTEVWVEGSWRGIDATLGQGRVGPGHVKISDTNWTDPPSLAPLLPVLRVMGRLQAKVVDFR
jgi:hypothetical protein